MSAILPTAYLNGRYMPLADARISPLDRGFLFGEGIYEVVPVYAGRSRCGAAHFERLARSCNAIDMENPLAGERGPEVVDALVRANGGGDMSVYIQITRGASTLPRNHVYPADAQPTVFAMCQSLAPREADVAVHGVAAVTRTDTRWQRCNIKSTSLLANTLLRQDAHEHGAVEAILLRDGMLTEAASSSVFVVTDDAILAPPAALQILPGTTAALVFELLTSATINYRIEPIDEATLRGAQEIWLSSATKRVLPVCTLDGAAVGSGVPGPRWQALDALYSDYLAALRTLEPIAPLASPGDEE